MGMSSNGLATFQQRESMEQWEQRQETRVCPHKIRAELEAKCRLLREGKGASLQNAFALAGIAISEMFRT